MPGDNTYWPVLNRIPRHIFKIEPVQVGETAVPAPYCDVAAPDRQIMKSVNTTVPAHSRHREGPDRPGPGFCKHPGFIHILNEGHENPCRTAGFAGDIGQIGLCPYMLVCHIPAVVAVGTVCCADEPVAHRGYVCIRGIINLSQQGEGPGLTAQKKSPDQGDCTTCTSIRGNFEKSAEDSGKKSKFI